MKFTEEHVTRATARWAISAGWEIVAVHPPDGQGPFVIPRKGKRGNIDRSSTHPDIVAVKPHEYFGASILIAECKLEYSDLESDREKLRQLANDSEALLFAFFRCQKFEFGPKTSCNYDILVETPLKDLPIEFVLSAKGTKASNRRIGAIGHFQATEILFSESDLLKLG